LHFSIEIDKSKLLQKKSLAIKIKTAKKVRYGFYLNSEGEINYINLTDERLSTFSPSYRSRKFEKGELGVEKFLRGLIRIINPREASSFVFSDSDRLRKHYGEPEPDKPATPRELR
jgi:hypothetical protein